MQRPSIRYIGLALLATGLAATTASLFLGYIRFYLVLVLPVLTSDNAIGLVSMLTAVAGFIVFTFSPFFDGEDDVALNGDDHDENAHQRGRPEIGGVVLIGPIPIIFGSDKRMALVAAAMMIMILAVALLLFL